MVRLDEEDLDEEDLAILKEVAQKGFLKNGKTEEVGRESCCCFVC